MAHVHVLRSAAHVHNNMVFDLRGGSNSFMRATQHERHWVDSSICFDVVGKVVKKGLKPVPASCKKTGECVFAHLR